MESPGTNFDNVLLPRRRDWRDAWNEHIQTQDTTHEISNSGAIIAGFVDRFNRGTSHYDV